MPDIPGEKRPFCVVPHRAIKDRRLKMTELRVLMALGYYANRAGVCWPSMKTLGDDAGITDSEVAKAIAKLMEADCIRQLNPNDYDQKKGVWGHSNRYQVLWRGDEPVPTWEEIKDANLMQPHDVRDIVEGSGARGSEEEDAEQGRKADALVAAWQAGVESALGWRPTTSERAAALRLAALGVGPIEVRAAAWESCRERAIKRLGHPSFGRIAEEIEALYKPQTTG